MESQSQPAPPFEPQHPAQPQPSQPYGIERDHVPTTARGRLKLNHWVIGTFPDHDAAQSCVDELVSSGFAADDVLVEAPGSAVQQVRVEEASTRDASRLAQVLYTLEETISGAGSELRARYIAEVHAGRWLAGAHDAQGIQIDRIRNVMIDHGGRCMYLFEPDDVRCLG